MQTIRIIYNLGNGKQASHIDINELKPPMDVNIFSYNDV